MERQIQEEKNPTRSNTSSSQSQQNSIALHPVVTRLFKKRGLDQNQIAEFLSWDLKTLPDLTQMHDLSKASQRIIKAIDNNEGICIYGDYDVDGTTSCALLYHFFKLLNVNVSTLQPSRFVEGYGLHNSSLDKAHEFGAKIVITVDCGISNCEAADYAKEIGIDLIITDHHKDAREFMPKAFAVINPNRRDEAPDSPLKNLAGVGVAFALALKIKNDIEANGGKCPSIYPLLQFVAIGTICDLALLCPLNLKLVRHGMKLIKTTVFPGIKTFFPPEDRALPVIPSEKLSFQVGPLINSKGRLDHPEKALELLLTDDQSVANLAFSHLELCNKERKHIQAQVFDSAREQFIAENKSKELPIAILYSSDWHEGVIGIVASKVVETFKVPAIIFTNAEEEGVIKASARNAGELNMFECLKKFEHYFIKFGGHKAAAGLSMKKENFDTFKLEMIEHINSIPAIVRTISEEYDLEISAKEIEPTLLKQLELLEPFGMGNQKPFFKMQNLKIDSYEVLRDVHVRWNLSALDNPSLKLKGISFNYLNKWDVVHPEDLFNDQHKKTGALTAYFSLGINRWNNREYIQLQIDKMSLESI